MSKTPARQSARRRTVFKYIQQQAWIRRLGPPARAPCAGSSHARAHLRSARVGRRRSEGID
jgi:hypothetical protein